MVEHVFLNTFCKEASRRFRRTPTPHGATTLKSIRGPPRERKDGGAFKGRNLSYHKALDVMGVLDYTDGPVAKMGEVCRVSQD